MKFSHNIAILFLLVSCHAKWQTKESVAILSLPAIHLLSMDSVTVFNTRDLPKGNPNFFFYFNPDCEHCQAMTYQLLAHFKPFETANIIFVSPAPITVLKKYIHFFHLDHYPNITFYNDYRYEFMSKFKINAFPDMIIYNKNVELTRFYREEIEIPRLIKAINL